MKFKKDKVIKKTVHVGQYYVTMEVNLFRFLVDAAIVGAVTYLGYKHLKKVQRLRAAYMNECECYYDLARRCGIVQSGDHTSIVKVILKTGEEIVSK